MHDIRTMNLDLKSSNGIQKTQGLFVEFGEKDAPYTLKNYDFTKEGREYISFSKVYSEAVDEYDAAMRLVGSMKHWNKLLTLKWFVEGEEQFGFEGVKVLREQMEQRDRSTAKAQLMMAASGGSVPAMKVLFDNAEIKTKGAGRPRKNESNKEDQDVASVITAFRKINS